MLFLRTFYNIYNVDHTYYTKVETLLLIFFNALKTYSLLRDSFISQKTATLYFDKIKLKNIWLFCGSYSHKHDLDLKIKQQALGKFYFISVDEKLPQY